MRVLPMFAGLMLLGTTPALADDADKQEIRRLQERLDLVEAKLEVLLAATSAISPATSPAAPQPTALQRTETFGTAPFAQRREVTPPELVPEIGKIGAEVGLVLSGSSNPFHLNRGQDAAGYIDLPLFESQKLHGKFGYEIRVGLSQANTKFQTTSNVAQVANLAALTTLNPQGAQQNLIDAVTGTGSAPFPVSAVTETRSKLLQVIPLSFRYTSTALDRFRLRPFAVIGFGTYVTIHNQVALNSGIRPDAALPPLVAAELKQIFSGSAPFGGALAAGQLTQSPELTARGLPTGAGNIDFGIHMGAGVEYRVSRGFSVGFDGRYNRLSGGQTLGTFGTRLGFHF